MFDNSAIDRLWILQNNHVVIDTDLISDKVTSDKAISTTPKKVVVSLV
jgi:hypothetical protein